MTIVPLISYGVEPDEIRALADNGHFLLKIKIGSDPDMDGDPTKMLEWDKRRLAQVHETVGDISTEHTASGKIAYYLDANGRYDSIERLRGLLDFADKIGALERTVILEEPFAEENKCPVHGLPVRIAADESAHSPEDVTERIGLGYGAIALKPIAKTMTITFRMIEEAYKRGTPCFCADLTVNPLLVEINKSFAARLATLPGLRLPVVEANGWQNYADWARMTEYNPACREPWARMSGGGFKLDESFYAMSGGMFMESAHYRDLALGGYFAHDCWLWA